MSDINIVVKWSRGDYGSDLNMVSFDTLGLACSAAMEDKKVGRLLCLEVFLDDGSSYEIDPSEVARKWDTTYKPRSKDGAIPRSNNPVRSVQVLYHGAWAEYCNVSYIDEAEMLEEDLGVIFGPDRVRIVTLP